MADVEVVHNTPGKNGEPIVIDIQDFQPQFAREAFRLMYQTYSEFNHTEGTCEAVGQYLRANCNFLNINIRGMQTQIL